MLPDPTHLPPMTVRRLPPRRLAALLLAAVLTLVVPRASAAQQPLPVGTASGWGLGAMTEARASEAALWNPALLGIFDGPTKSFSLLNLHAQPGDLHRASNLWQVFRGPDDEATLEGGFFDDWRRAEGDGRFGASAGMQWLGFHAQDLAITANSYGYWRQQAPERILMILSGLRSGVSRPLTEAELDRASDFPSQFSLASIAAIGKGGMVAQDGAFGPTWAGLTLKGGIIHEHASGRFHYRDAESLNRTETGVIRDDELEILAGDVGFEYVELGVRETKVAALDAGVAANPSPPILLSATAVNVFQKTWLDENTLFERRLIGLAPTPGGHARTFFEEEPFDFGEGDERRVAEADELLQDTHFLRAVRGGASLDTRWGRISGGVTVPLEDGGIDRAYHDRFTVGIQPFVDFAPRLSVSRGLDDSWALRGGFQHGLCDTRVALSGGYLTGGERGDSFEVGLSFSFGQPPCGLY